MKSRTECDLCHSIAHTMETLPQEDVENIKRLHAKTCSIVELYKEGLVRPTKAALVSLIDLVNVVDAAWQRAAENGTLRVFKK